MTASGSTLVLTGSRAWSVFGLAVTLTTACIVMAVAVACHSHGDSVAALVAAALGTFILFNAVDWAARSIRPNRLRLDDDGLCLSTWRGPTCWRWHAYRGVSGYGFTMLRVEVHDGRIKAVPIGHWPRDLALQLHEYACTRSVGDGKLPELTPSAAPNFIVSGVLVLVAAAVAWFSLSG